MSAQASTSKTWPPPPKDPLGTIVVVGGGIAGISCVEALFQEYDQFNPQFKLIVLISDERLIKRVSNYQASGRQLENFDVVHEEIDNLEASAPQGLRFCFLVGTVTKIFTGVKKKLVYENNSLLGSGIPKGIEFDILCICNGARPKQLIDCSPRDSRSEIEKRTIVIRDTNTVRDLQERLSNCKRIVIVGNGGISLEVVTKIANCEKVWIIRDESIGLTFFDPGAAKFLLDASARDDDNGLLPMNESSRISFTSTNFSRSPFQTLGTSKPPFGPSLGPNWSQNFELSGGSLSSHKLDIIYKDELADIFYTGANRRHPLIVVTRNKKKRIDCDLVVLAIGVTPNKMDVIGDVELEINDSDGGIIIDNQMRTSVNQIYAAGDCVSCEKWPSSELWFQMRLWTQARQMGHYAGRCITLHILRQDPSIYYNFDCFTHCTSFFGYKLVLLGRFNGPLTLRNFSSSTGEAGNGSDSFEIIARVNPGRDYVKILVGESGRIFGAVLVGDSGLEETIENLIHDRIDISAYKDQLLDGTVDIEDYFD